MKNVLKSIIFTALAAAAIYSQNDAVIYYAVIALGLVHAFGSASKFALLYVMAKTPGLLSSGFYRKLLDAHSGRTDAHYVCLALIIGMYFHTGHSGLAILSLSEAFLIFVMPRRCEDRRDTSVESNLPAIASS